VTVKSLWFPLGPNEWLLAESHLRSHVNTLFIRFGDFRKRITAFSNSFLIFLSVTIISLERETAQSRCPCCPFYRTFSVNQSHNYSVQRDIKNIHSRALIFDPRMKSSHSSLLSTTLLIQLPPSKMSHHPPSPFSSMKQQQSRELSRHKTLPILPL
jgi:hypothetical protein